MVFRWLQNGVVVPFLDFAAAPLNPATARKEMWANFMGSPSAYFVWAVPQDGISNPADFNDAAPAPTCAASGTARSCRQTPR